jgi:UDP-N-acetyl-2-amino-2-deoxyglucuronate dehydrogenase
VKQRSPIIGRPIRIGLVGCGRIARNHLAAIRAASGDLELVGLCDVDPAALAQAAGEQGAPGFSSLTGLLAGVAPDLVSLCTPSGLHPAQALEAARAGADVISEKPMATRWSEGVAMVEGCAAAGARLFVVKQNRLNPTLQLLKRAIDEGRFGRLYLAQANVFWTRPQDYYDASPWRGTRALDGGAFMNQASHYVDLMRWLVGPVRSVQALTATLARRIEMEDTGVVSLRYADGALGSMSVTMLTHPRNLEGSITLLGEKGSARIGGVALNRVEVWDFADARDYDAGARSASYETASVYGSGHGVYYRNVVEVLRGQAAPVTDGAQGLDSLELLAAIYRSAQDGVMVELPLPRDQEVW